MGVRLTWTDCDEAGDYVMHNVLCPRDLVSNPDNMDETALHTPLSNTFYFNARMRFFKKKSQKITFGRILNVKHDCKDNN